MDVESISGAATVALTSTFIFVLIAKSWQLVARTIGSNPSFSDSIMRESAQRFRDEFERLNSEQSTFLSAVVVFGVLFAAAYILNAERLFVGYPYWQLYLLLAALSAGALLAAYRLAKTVRARRHVKLKRDANIAVGHELQRMATILGRTYHDVETSAGIIDHIVVGQNGAYAINVVARRSVRNGNVALQGKELLFTPVNKTHSIVATAAMVASRRPDGPDTRGLESRLLMPSPRRPADPSLSTAARRQPGDQLRLPRKRPTGPRRTPPGSSARA